MRRAICTATIMFLTVSMVLPVAASQSDPDAACRQKLQNLAAAITTYKIIHDGRKPEKLSDLYSEGLIASLSDFVVPGSETTLRTHADIDAQTGFVMAGPGDAQTVLVREKTPRAGRGTILVATADGNILTIAAGMSNPGEPPAPATTRASARSSGFQTGATQAGPSGSAARTPSPSGFQTGATRAGPSNQALTQGAPPGGDVRPIGQPQPGDGLFPAGNASSAMQASLLGSWVADGPTSTGLSYRCMVVFENAGAYSGGVWVDGKMVERLSGAYRLVGGQLILMPEGEAAFDASMRLQAGTLFLILPNFPGGVTFVRQAQPGGR
jgi:hypothetical protein